MANTSNAQGVRIRPLAAADLGAVVAIDAAGARRTRRDYIERRLAAARREPELHVQLAAEDGQGLAGYILARVLAGEFGRSRPMLWLELVGVRPELRGEGLGRALFDALAAWRRRHMIEELRTVASWRDTQMLGWFDAVGFELAPDQIVDCAVEGGAYRAGRDDDLMVRSGEVHPGAEIDYGRPQANDYERLARDEADVRSMIPSDLDAIAHIDRGITGHERRDYIAARLAEAMQDSGVRVSLTARCDGVPAGYLMARADLGDFGRTEPVALIDTLGVDPDYAHRGIGHTLISQLFANLGALRVERVETVVPQRDLELLGFLYSCGFAPSQRLAFVHRLGLAS